MSDKIDSKKVAFATRNRDFVLQQNAIQFDDKDRQKMEELQAKLAPLLDEACLGYTPGVAAISLQMLVDCYLSMTMEFDQEGQR